MAASAKSHGKNPSETDYKIYIQRILKSSHPNTGLSGGALDSLSEIVHSITRRLANNVNVLLSVSDKATLSAREASAAVKLTVPIGLSKGATAAGERAVSSYTRSVTEDANSGVKTSVTQRAGILVSVSRVGRLLRTASVSKRQGPSAAIFIAAVLEYLLKEILDVAARLSIELKKVRITNRNILLAVRTNSDLNSLLPEHSTVLAGGVVPHIDESLMNKK